MARTRKVVDGNEAAASVAYRCSEVIAIYPITPSSAMGELSDAWAAAGRQNLWGDPCHIVQMQSEGGVAGAVHGALQAGSLTTTFTASQGLLLMLPDLYKLAGELTACCLHVAARSVATHALSIFGDHSDVMACRQTGMALLFSASVQEAHDLAAVGHAATLTARVPVLHAFDGFRTSHELATIEELDDADLVALLDADGLTAHRERALSPERPVLRGTAQNPDAFFQAREAANRYHGAMPGHVQAAMDALAARTGRQYHLFDYHGHPQAERVVVLMGSGAVTARETVERLAAAGERVGALTVRLYRPFDVAACLAALPESTRALAVLDRTKEPGAPGEPLYLDVVAAVDRAWPAERGRPVVIGGRYGLSSKEFTPAMVVAALDELDAERPRHPFTLGVTDDVTHLSLPVGEGPELLGDDVFEAVFFGLGSDGTVGANKNSIKIIGDHAERSVQAYFVYDSKKSGAATVSHLRFGPRPIHAPYLVTRARFVACHQPQLLERFDVLDVAAPGATVLLNAPWPVDEVWDRLPVEVQQQVLDKQLVLHAIDGYAVARDAGLGGRISTVMQTCFFALADVLPLDQALAAIKQKVATSYGKLGPETVRRNLAAIDAALDQLHLVPVPGRLTSGRGRRPVMAPDAPDFVQRVQAVLAAGKGDGLPVSAFPVDGTWPVGTSRWEKRDIAQQIPSWDPDVCVQCNQCALVCPHAAIRAAAYDPAELEGAPAGFLSTPCRVPGLTDRAYTIQVAPEDCTGCSLCVEVCPAKDRGNPRHKAIDMVDHDELIDSQRPAWDFFTRLPATRRDELTTLDARGSQFLQPLFEFSGACAGCGETPYLKLLTQLFGDEMMVANATGCSSIYGANLPTTPWREDDHGKGPAWSNSLFEDNAEFGLGMRLAADQQRAHALRLLERLAPRLPFGLVSALMVLDPSSGARAREARVLVAQLREALEELSEPAAAELAALAEALVPRSVWLVGGDGWAYDIGYGGLDHVLGTGRDVNVLVLDTEVYSNTGGQASKATPLGAAAKFAATGKSVGKKDLGLEAMSHGHVYVARIALGADPNQAVKAFLEARSWPGPSLIIAYSPCIAHGYDLRHGAAQSKRAVRTGAWPLYRFDPRRAETGEPPLVLDSGAPRHALAEFQRHEARFRMVERSDPKRHALLMGAAQDEVHRRRAIYEQLAGMTVPRPAGEQAPDDATPTPAAP